MILKSTRPLTMPQDVPLLTDMRHQEK